MSDEDYNEELAKSVDMIVDIITRLTEGACALDEHWRIHASFLRLLEEISAMADASESDAEVNIYAHLTNRALEDMVYLKQISSEEEIELEVEQGRHILEQILGNIDKTENKEDE